MEEVRMEDSRKQSIILGIILAIPGLIVLIIAMFVVALFVIKLLWAWTIPDLFPGAVAQGLIAEHISWYAAFKLAIFIGVMAGIAGARHKRAS
jgi:hypothetical protein